MLLVFNVNSGQECQTTCRVNIYVNNRPSAIVRYRPPPAAVMIQMFYPLYFRYAVNIILFVWCCINALYWSVGHVGCGLKRTVLAFSTVVLIFKPFFFGSCFCVLFPDWMNRKRAGVSVVHWKSSTRFLPLKNFFLHIPSKKKKKKKRELGGKKKKNFNARRKRHQQTHESRVEFVLFFLFPPERGKAMAATGSYLTKTGWGCLLLNLKCHFFQPTWHRRLFSSPFKKRIDGYLWALG